MRFHLQHHLLATAIAASILIGAMGCGRTTRPEPPVIHPGEDVCAHCNMIVNEERFAVAHLLTDPSPAEPALFDDIACLIAAEAQHPQNTVVARWVNAADEPGWIDASSAYFVISPEIRSPMAGGVLATKKEDAAQELLQKTPGKLLRFDELRMEMEKGESNGS